jgi:hypothetical protein
MNVLLIAPTTNLPAVEGEVRAVSLALHAAVLSGTVNRKDVIDALGGHVWDVVWFACHGDSKGVYLSDGAVPIADLTAIIRNSGAYLVVLNTCSSRYVGLEMHYELHVAVICTESEANDTTAYQTGAFLARNLAQGLGIREAFERSRPGQDHLYHLFMETQRKDDDELRTIRFLNEWGTRVNGRIDAIERKLEADIEGIHQEIASIRPDIRQLANTMELTSAHEHSFWLGFVTLFMPVPLYYSQVRDIIGVSWLAALAFAACCFLVSAALWRYMWWGNRARRPATVSA